MTQFIKSMSTSVELQTVHIIDNSVIKHIFYGEVWNVSQKVVKCFIIPLYRFSYIYWLIHFGFLRKEALVTYSLIKLLLTLCQINNANSEQLLFSIKEQQSVWNFTGVLLTEKSLVF